jgi:hypothetical protein
MSPLREQLQAARAEHRAARFPGDLASLVLPSAAPLSPWRMRWVNAGVGLAAAATVMIVIGMATLSPSPMQAWLPSANDLPRMPPRAEMAGAIKSVTPPQASDLLMDVKDPLVSSGKFILDIGKDIAHHADALFHMG